MIFVERGKCILQVRRDFLTFSTDLRLNWKRISLHKYKRYLTSLSTHITVFVHDVPLYKCTYKIQMNEKSCFIFTRALNLVPKKKKLIKTRNPPLALCIPSYRERSNDNDIDKLCTRVLFFAKNMDGTQSS